MHSSATSKGAGWRGTRTGSGATREVDVPRYYLGVIDMLQKWNLNKRVERWAKIILKGRWAEGVRNGMSAIEPETYRRRFLAGMSYQLGLASAEAERARGGGAARGRVNGAAL